MQPIENSLFAALTPARWRSTGYGLKFVCTFGVGSVAVWLVAWIRPTYGLSRVFVALAAVVALLLVAIAAFAMSTARDDGRYKCPTSLSGWADARGGGERAALAPVGQRAEFSL